MKKRILICMLGAALAGCATQPVPVQQNAVPIKTGEVQIGAEKITYICGSVKDALGMDIVFCDGYDSSGKIVRSNTASQAGWVRDLGKTIAGSSGAATGTGLILPELLPAAKTSVSVSSTTESITKSK